MERSDIRDEIEVDEVCARCATPLVATVSVVRRDGGLYCCGSCAQAALGEKAGLGEACSHCGAPISDRRSAVTSESRLFCCANCAVAPRDAERPVV